MTSEQAAFLLSVFIAEVKRESLTTLRVLLAVPADKGRLPSASEIHAALSNSLWHLGLW